MPNRAFSEDMIFRLVAACVREDTRAQAVTCGPSVGSTHEAHVIAGRQVTWFSVVGTD